MMSFNILSPADNLGIVEKELLTNYVYKKCILPSKPDKQKVSWSVDHATSIFPHQGGCIIKLMDDGQMVGVGIVNKTGMENQISGNLLSHVALEHDNDHALKMIIDKAKNITNNDIQSVFDTDKLSDRVKEIYNETPKKVQLMAI
ncbi:MAG: hypothetical protein RJQ09_10480 [Cyclobacteriaceae bacterium]